MFYDEGDEGPAKVRGDKRRLRLNTQIGGTQNRRQAKRNGDEKFAGMVNDTVWKYNPNSYYNADNSKGKQGAEHYQDQRAFFLHRKHLADAIEKARRQDPVTAQ